MLAVVRMSKIYLHFANWIRLLAGVVVFDSLVLKTMIGLTCHDLARPHSIHYKRLLACVCRVC